ncbi:MAG: helicase [Deltaproteobacteria bacterium HGW-Deltaproteobacteria-15]|jgi:ATP-dependent DNA helicase DinG|nr:MAG: helicase [Deltaproteobacteria bacterium HGW-Deltaproteobacteria-15]
MTDSPDPIEEILGSDGGLARSLNSFEYRPSQLRMAQVIRRAVHENIPAVVEAGTGTGKTLGYLVPLFLSGKKIVISTATKTLQEQIFSKDIPLLSVAAGHPIDAMLMKGRKNYLCLYRYHQHLARPALFKTRIAVVQDRIQQWLEHTQFADRAELSWMRDDDPLWDAISSTSDQCLGSECPQWGECFLNSLRWSAARAQFLIVNHHLFFADLMVKRSGFGEIIPRFQVVLFDEAHSIEEIATAYLGISVSTNQLLELAADLKSEIANNARSGGKNLEMSLDLIRTGCEHLREMLGKGDEKGRLDPDTKAAIMEVPGREIREGLKSLLRSIPSDRKTEEGTVSSLLKRSAELEEGLGRILTLDDPQWLTWYENRRKTLILHGSPLEIAGSMQELLYKKNPGVLFTSATLSTRGNFDYFKERLGLSQEVLTEVYPSHFDFEHQTVLYVPRDLPVPGDPDFGRRIAERIGELLNISEGRALVLFTSYHNLDLVHQYLMGSIPYALLKQGDGPRSALLEEFRNDTHSVLLATGSFWEGVDVPGESLSSLIIDKLPFGSPGDPLVAARIDLIRSRQENPFMKYQLPSAIIGLKQGLGRLIRGSTDRGLLSILDSRLLTSRYGRFFLESLPKIPLTNDLEEVRRFFNESHARKD